MCFVFIPFASFVSRFLERDDGITFIRDSWNDNIIFMRLNELCWNSYRKLSSKSYIYISTMFKEIMKNDMLQRQIIRICL